MAVIITDRAKLNTTQLRRLHDLMGTKLSHPIAQLQIVSLHSLTIQCSIHGTWAVQTTIIMWSLVMVYPLDHELVPPHRRATSDEVDILLGPRKPGVGRIGANKLSQLPCLRLDDAIAHYLALKPGEVVHIDRLDGSVYYRVIVKIA